MKWLSDNAKLLFVLGIVPFVIALIAYQFFPGWVSAKAKAEDAKVSPNGERIITLNSWINCADKSCLITQEALTGEWSRSFALPNGYGPYAVPIAEGAKLKLRINGSELCSYDMDSYGNATVNGSPLVVGVNWNCPGATSFQVRAADKQSEGKEYAAWAAVSNK